MGRIDGTSRDNCRPAGVADAFQISTHSVEPILSNRCRNLFSHEDRGPTGADKLKEDGPEVPFVFRAFLPSGDGEGLAGGAACPQGSLVGPASEACGVGPAADTSEEVALDVPLEVFRSHVANGPFIYITLCYQIIVDQIAQPLRCVGVYFIVVSSHASISPVDHRQA